MNGPYIEYLTQELHIHVGNQSVVFDDMKHA